MLYDFNGWTSWVYYYCYWLWRVFAPYTHYLLIIWVRDDRDFHLLTWSRPPKITIRKKYINPKLLLDGLFWLVSTSGSGFKGWKHIFGDISNQKHHDYRTNSVGPGITGDISFSNWISIQKNVSLILLTDRLIYRYYNKNCVTFITLPKILLKHTIDCTNQNVQQPQRPQQKKRFQKSQIGDEFPSHFWITTPILGNRHRFLGSAMGIAIAHRKNRNDFGVLKCWALSHRCLMLKMVCALTEHNC